MPFPEDLAWANRVRDLVLSPSYYRGERYVHLDGEHFLALALQRHGVDTVVGRHGEPPLWIEEKIVRRRDQDRGSSYTAYSLETARSPEAEAAGRYDGWMRTSKADLLVYGFVEPDRLNVHTLPMQALKQWFWERADLSLFRQVVGEDGDTAVVRVVPFAAVKDAGVRVHQSTHFPSSLDLVEWADLARPKS